MLKALCIWQLCYFYPFFNILALPCSIAFCSRYAVVKENAYLPYQHKKTELMVYDIIVCYMEASAMLHRSETWCLNNKEVIILRITACYVKSHVWNEVDGQKNH